MLTKLQSFKEECEEGFTLIELLVVILIIGILSAIAIPAFLNQRKSAVDASVQSDVSNAAKQVETWIVKQGATAKTIPSAGAVGNGSIGTIKVSDGTELTIMGTSFNYIIRATNTGGDVSNPDGDSTKPNGIYYSSIAGGLVKAKPADPIKVNSGNVDVGIAQFSG